ncbi:MAG: hypothetical protein EA351_03305 [Gemmatimonadales bacterium]|nr:MAG: hypothetical protein EA351_03305 [Gemmatimonadales bacterium]
MIEVNLRPDTKKGKKRGGGRSRSFALPKVSGVPSDPWILSAGGLSLLALLVFGWFFLDVAGEAEELQVRIDAAQADSARFADVIARAEALTAQRDSIAARVSVIQEIDGARYVWPHLMDEVGRAIPDYTWINRFLQVSPPPNLAFRVHGQAATIFALTIFLENLEASPFIRNARLISADQAVITLGGDSQRLIYNFVVEASHQEPPPELLNREPLFGPSVAIPGFDDTEPPAETSGEES